MAISFKFACYRNHGKSHVMLNTIKDIKKVPIKFYLISLLKREICWEDGKEIKNLMEKMRQNEFKNTKMDYHNSILCNFYNKGIIGKNWH